MAKKVLVVDDEKLIVKGIRFSLEQDGMEVDCAYDGEEAIAKAKETEYEVVLLDVMLPKFDGLEVCQAIREFSEMPIIMLTAKGGDMDKIMGLEYGADVLYPGGEAQDQGHHAQKFQEGGEAGALCVPDHHRRGFKAGRRQPPGLHRREGDQPDRQGI